MKKDNFFRQAARWVAHTFGYKAENKFGRIVWYVFATCSTIIVLFTVIGIVIGIIDDISDARSDLKRQRKLNDISYLHAYNNTYVSPNVIHHDGGTSYLYNTVEKRRTITGVHWICKSADDSLAFYSKDDKRGYFNIYNGEPVIPAKYEKAWVFSEGVAWVMDQGRLHLIDHCGKDVLDQTFPFTEKIDSYCFHYGLSPAADRDGRVGFINKQGEWVVDPAYHYAIYKDKGLWLAWDKDGNEGMIGPDGQVFLPFVFSHLSFDYDNQYIYGRRNDHLDLVYDFQGNLLNPCSYEEVMQMDYYTDKFVLNAYSEDYERETASANCLKYRTSDYHYGLMDKNGKIVTPPMYDNIEAIAKDRYFCEGEMGAVVLDDKGQECDKKQF